MYLNKWSTDAKHTLRTRRTLVVWGLASLLLGLGWSGFFAFRGQWNLVAFEGVLALAGVASLLLVRANHLRSAALVLIAIAFTAICLVAIYQDLPSAAAPRVVHQYFIVMGVGSLLIFRTESLWLRLGVPAACFLMFMVFASTNWGIQGPHVLPDDVRVAGSWLHIAVSLGLMLALLYVMQSDVHSLHSMAADLRKALPRNQFELYYQAQVAEDGAVSGAEALLRWNRPGEGLIAPGDFIPVAEQTGAIASIGHWVLGTACAQLVRWASQPHTRHLTLAVNVSAQQFKQSDFVNQVLSVIERSGANPARLKIELTESMLVNDVDDIITKMTQLRDLGIGLSLDDFGTGYSSLAYLKRLPLDQLKIDASFVRDVLTDQNAAAIARTVVNLARDMHLNVIAEGVETEAHRGFLMSIGCRAFQGYLFSRPLPAAEFEAYAATAKTPSPGSPAPQA